MTEPGLQQRHGRNERDGRNGTAPQDDLLGRNRHRAGESYSGAEELPGRNAMRGHGSLSGASGMSGSPERTGGIRSADAAAMAVSGWELYRKEPEKGRSGSAGNGMNSNVSGKSGAGTGTGAGNRAGNRAGNGIGIGNVSGNGSGNRYGNGSGGQPPFGGPAGGGPAGGKKKSSRTFAVVGVLLVLFLAYGLYRYFWSPEPIAESPVGQAVAGLLSPDDKGESLRANRVHEANIKPFPLLAAKPDIADVVSPSAINILVIARDVEANLYDTLLVVSMNPGNGKVRLINIPRDLYVDYSKEAVALIRPRLANINSDPALRKINAAHKLGKIIKYRADTSRFGTPDYDFTADLIEEMFSLSIDDFVFVKPESFREIVDRFGGVRVDVPFAMRYSDPTQDLKIDLQAGEQLLDGVNAEGFVRFRKGYNSKGKWFEIGDLGRKENQNLFVKAFMEQHLTLGKMGLILDLANNYTNYMETSIVGDKKVGDYAQLGKNLIKATLAIEPVELETKYQKINGHQQFVLGSGITKPGSSETGGKNPDKTSDKGGTTATPKPSESASPQEDTATEGAIDAPDETAVATDALPTDGTDPDGTDPDGTDPDGTNPDGTDPGGTNPDGTNPDGTNPDSSGTDEPSPATPEGTDPPGGTGTEPAPNPIPEASATPLPTPDPLPAAP